VSTPALWTQTKPAVWSMLPAEFGGNFLLPGTLGADGGRGGVMAMGLTKGKYSIELVNCMVQAMGAASSV
jgi:hypothetical protein